MTAVHLMLAVWLLGNATWTVLLIRDYRSKIKLYRAMDLASDNTKLAAENLLRSARSVVQAAAIEQEHKVCDVCGRIVTRHITDERETRCVNCEADRVNGYRLGAKIG